MKASLVVSGLRPHDRVKRSAECRKSNVRAIRSKSRLHLHRRGAPHTLGRGPGAPALSRKVRTGVTDRLIVRGAREHNLKNVSLDLPRDSLIVFTGLSGSGKSSLAFDTIFAEGQRRYVESLSSYARQFIGQMATPDVDF